MTRWWPVALLCACGPDRGEAPAMALQEAVQGEVRCRNAPYDGYRGCIETSYGQPLRIRYRHEMGRSFVLVGASIAIDRGMVFESNDRELLGNEEVPIYDGRTSAGPHLLAVVLRVRGEGSGVFSYLRGYRFQVKSSCMVDTRANDTLVLVLGIDRGGPTTPLEERPGVHFDIHHDQGRRQGRCVQ